MPVIEHTPSARILKGTNGPVEIAIYVDGVLTNADVAPTVTVLKADGTTLAGPSAATSVSTGRYRLALTPAQTASLQPLTVQWAVTIGGETMTLTTRSEIVGDQLFAVAEARAFGDGRLSDSAEYGDLAILLARDRIQDAFEEICGQAFMPRAKRVTLNGDDRSVDRASLWMPDLRVTSLTKIETRTAGTQTWTAFTAAELADTFVTETGRIYRETLGTWPAGVQNIRVEYEYGRDRVPSEIKRAALVVLANHVPASDISNRTLSLTDEIGTYRFAAAGERGAWFGLPDVDAVLDRYNAGGTGRMV